MSEQEEKARDVKRRYAAQYLQRPEVISFGIEKDATGQDVIMITVNTKDPEIHKQFPSDLEGVPVRVEYREPYRAQKGRVTGNF